MHLALVSEVLDQLGDVRLAYLAGLVDGEGYVGLRAPLRPGHKQRPVIAVAMTYKATIELPRDSFGFCVFAEFEPRKEWHKRSWRWTATGRQAFVVAQLLEPFSVTKKSALQSIIAHYATFGRRLAGNPGKRGTENARTKLSDSAVAYIRAMPGVMKQRALAVRFGVNRQKPRRLQIGGGVTCIWR